ncbi:MAG: beta propeller repeat protein, partial [Planctomycetota bacterium]
MFERKWIQALILAPVLLGFTGCGLLGVGSTAGALFFVLYEPEDEEDEYIYPPVPTIDLVTPAQAGPPGGRVTALGGTATSPLFAGTHRGGVFRSTNNGDDWAAVNSGFFKDLTVTAIAVDPNDDDLVLVGTGLVYA